MYCKFVYLSLIVCIFLTLPTACTPTMYGIPVEQWERLNDEQKMETIKGYNERQLLRQQEYAQAQEARAVAAKAAREAATQTSERSRAEYADALRYGDFLRIVIKGGTVRFAGKSRAYDPVAFSIANGETLRVPIIGGSGRQVALVVNYSDGVLSLDPKHENGLREATRLVYEPGWKQGKTYEPLNSRGGARLAGVSLYVEIIPVETKGRR